MKTTFGIKPGTAIWLLFAAGAAILAIAGCDANTESGFATSEETDDKVLYTPEPLKLLAIGVPDFDAEISRQWAAERDGDLKIEHLSLDEFDTSDASQADVDLILHPSTINADLVSRGMVRVFPRDGLDDPEMNLSAFLLHFRKALVRHDDKTWSVSLGGHQLRLFYRRDILDAAQIAVPETWEDLTLAIDKLNDVESARELTPIVIPTAGESAGQMFMARVACLIRDQGKLTSFFDRRTMEPTVASAPFETALEEVKRLAEKTGGTFSVSEVFQKFAAGQAVFAIAWPSLDESIDADSIEKESAKWGVVRLPGSPSFYDLKESRWYKRSKDEDVKVDLLGIAANNISVASGTSNAKDAAEFVVWLTSKRNSQKLLQSTSAPFRAIHLARVGQWYSMEQADRKLLDQLADSITETHDSRIFLMFPQLPGKRQYLKILDDAVAEFLADQAGDAKATLGRVAKEWESVTESHGRQSQINELRRGNGI
ncbi:ABC transporter substrate-binding protein [Mariniblastus fucicola]|uniref:Bacterial extracellular solute-binding protein n=1 Tax=Mariniblastus fucicola TaxID=980251 RepID=A0A5B9PIE5_9BACT|nr:extracellular solute-binding protein [Mariniblastus fucicola]QEG22403.1 Bacterial extracellular solute-binding protein [Mariniblastus fucicola]